MFRESTTFLKWSVMLLMFFSCSESRPAQLQNEPRPSVDKQTTAKSTQEANSNTSTSNPATVETGRESGETAVAPTLITGVFLACDFQPPPVAGATSAKLGCRIADNDTGAKHDMSQHPEFTWGYELVDTSLTASMTPASVDDPWHVYYDITNRLGTLNTLQDMMKVGLKLKDNSATYYQKIGDVIGKLGLLLNGTWIAPCYQQDQSGVYIKSTTNNKSDKTSVTYNEHHFGSPCTNSPQFVSETASSFLNLVYLTGVGFAADVKYTSWKFTPRDAEGLSAVQQMCPGSTFKLNVATEVSSCMHWNSSRVQYTTLRLDEKRQPPSLMWGIGGGANTGETPELRMTNFPATGDYIKQ
jgi:hypothetical protein